MKNLICGYILNIPSIGAFIHGLSFDSMKWFFAHEVIRVFHHIYFAVHVLIIVSLCLALFSIYVVDAVHTVAEMIRR